MAKTVCESAWPEISSYTQVEGIAPKSNKATLVASLFLMAF